MHVHQPVGCVNLIPEKPCVCSDPKIVSAGAKSVTSHLDMQIITAVIKRWMHIQNWVLYLSFAQDTNLIVEGRLENKPTWLLNAPWKELSFPPKLLPFRVIGTATVVVSFSVLKITELMHILFQVELKSESGTVTLGRWEIYITLALSWDYVQEKRKREDC